jgi:hypothetical protein
MNDIGQVRAGERAVGVHIVVDPRDPQIRHDILPEPAAAPAAFNYTVVTEFRSVGNSPFAGYSKFFNT